MVAVATKKADRAVSGIRVGAIKSGNLVERKCWQKQPGRRRGTRSVSLVDAEVAEDFVTRPFDQAIELIGRKRRVEPGL
jgi:hypothetical protein